MEEKHLPSNVSRDEAAYSKDKVEAICQVYPGRRSCDNLQYLLVYSVESVHYISMPLQSHCHKNRGVQNPDDTLWRRPDIGVVLS